MKRMISLLAATLMCVLLIGGTFATALSEGNVGCGKVIDSGTADASYIGPLELSDYIGWVQEDFKAYAEEIDVSLPMGAIEVENRETEDGKVLHIINGFNLKEGCSCWIYGYSVNGRHDYDLVDKMEAEGWTTIRKLFEGGLQWFTFEKTVEDKLYEFKLNSCDYVITGVSLSVKDAEEAGTAQE